MWKMWEKKVTINTHKVKVKGKVHPVQALRLCTGAVRPIVGGITLLFLDHGPRRE